MNPRPRNEVDMNTYAGKFAVHIKQLRVKAKLTVEELAEKTGISVRTIYAWESGQRSAIIDQLPELAEGLGVDISKILPNP